MSRVALQISPALVEGICQMVDVETQPIFGDSTYAVVEMVGPREITIKLMTDDEIFEIAKNDPNLQIASL